MIIEKDYYRINIKTGNIIKRQRVWVKCDGCGAEWETLYEYIKYKKLKNDLCPSCRAKNNAGGGKKYRKRKQLCCDYCGKNFKRSINLVKSKNYCSRLCVSNSYLKNRYGHLEEIFDKNPDEVAYLFGVILGDGNFKKTEQKNTTRITIAFDVKWQNLLNIFLEVLEKLKIKYFVEPKTYKNCQLMGFVFPDQLLKKYSLDYIGSKYKAQPEINKNISSNINFVAGMINSDGCCTRSFNNNKNKKKYERIVISGITESIINSCCYCLNVNSIDHKLYHRQGRVDKRNGNLNKDSHIVAMCKIKSINRLRDKTAFKIKESSNG